MGKFELNLILNPSNPFFFVKKAVNAFGCVRAARPTVCMDSTKHQDVIAKRDDEMCAGRGSLGSAQDAYRSRRSFDGKVLVEGRTEPLGIQPRVG